MSAHVVGKGVEGTLEELDRAGRVATGASTADRDRKPMDAGEVTGAGSTGHEQIDEAGDGWQPRDAGAALAGGLRRQPAEQSSGFREAARVVRKRRDEPASHRCADISKRLAIE